MLENEENLQEYPNGRKKKKKKKKKKKVLEYDESIMEICSASTVSLEPLSKGLAASSETLGGEENVGEVSAEVSASESVTVEKGERRRRKRKKRRQQLGNEEEEEGEEEYGAPVESETEGVQGETGGKKKKKRKKRPEESAEGALETPAGETVSAEDRGRRKKRKKRPEESAEGALETPAGETVSAEDRGRRKKRKRRRHSHVELDRETAGEEDTAMKEEDEEEDCTVHGSPVPSDDQEEKGVQNKLDGKALKLSTAHAAAADQDSVDDDLDGEEESIR